MLAARDFSLNLQTDRLTLLQTRRKLHNLVMQEGTKQPKLVTTTPDIHHKLRGLIDYTGVSATPVQIEQLLGSDNAAILVSLLDNAPTQAAALEIDGILQHASRNNPGTGHILQPLRSAVDFALPADRVMRITKAKKGDDSEVRDMMSTWEKTLKIVYKGGTGTASNFTRHNQRLLQLQALASPDGGNFVTEDVVTLYGYVLVSQQDNSPAMDKLNKSKDSMSKLREMLMRAVQLLEKKSTEDGGKYALRPEISSSQRNYAKGALRKVVGVLSRFLGKAPKAKKKTKTKRSPRPPSAAEAAAGAAVARARARSTGGGEKAAAGGDTTNRKKLTATHAKLIGKILGFTDELRKHDDKDALTPEETAEMRVSLEKRSVAELRSERKKLELEHRQKKKESKKAERANQKEKKREQEQRQRHLNRIVKYGGSREGHDEKSVGELKEHADLLAKKKGQHKQREQQIQRIIKYEHRNGETEQSLRSEAENMSLGDLREKANDARARAAEAKRIAKLKKPEQLKDEANDHRENIHVKLDQYKDLATDSRFNERPAELKQFHTCLSKCEAKLMSPEQKAELKKTQAAKMKAAADRANIEEVLSEEERSEERVKQQREQQERLESLAAESSNTELKEEIEQMSPEALIEKLKDRGAMDEDDETTRRLNEYVKLQDPGYLAKTKDEYKRKYDDIAKLYNRVGERFKADNDARKGGGFKVRHNQRLTEQDEEQLKQAITEAGKTPIQMSGSLVHKVGDLLTQLGDVISDMKVLQSRPEKVFRLTAEQLLYGMMEEEMKVEDDAAYNDMCRYLEDYQNMSAPPMSDEDLLESLQDDDARKEFLRATYGKVPGVTQADLKEMTQSEDIKEMINWCLSGEDDEEDVVTFSKEMDDDGGDEADLAKDLSNLFESSVAPKEPPKPSKPSEQSASSRRKKNKPVRTAPVVASAQTESPPEQTPSSRRKKKKPVRAAPADVNMEMTAEQTSSGSAQSGPPTEVQEPPGLDSMIGRTNIEMKKAEAGLFRDKTMYDEMVRTNENTLFGSKTASEEEIEAAEKMTISTINTMADFLREQAQKGTFGDDTLLKKKILQLRKDDDVGLMDIVDYLYPQKGSPTAFTLESRILGEILGNQIRKQNEQPERSAGATEELDGFIVPDKETDEEDGADDDFIVPDTESDEADEADEIGEKDIVSGKRRRKQVDYKSLNDSMGDDSEDSDDTEFSDEEEEEDELSEEDEDFDRMNDLDGVSMDDESPPR